MKGTNSSGDFVKGNRNRAAWSLGQYARRAHNPEAAGSNPEKSS